MSLAVERFDARSWPDSELDLLFEGAFPAYITAGQAAKANIGRSVSDLPSGTPPGGPVYRGLVAARRAV